MKKILVMSLVLSLCIVNRELFAQNYQLSGRSALGLNLGMYHGTKSSNIVAIGGFNTTVDAAGFAGGLVYSNWLQENLSLEVSIGTLSGSAKVSVNSFNTTQQASTVMPIMLGLNYYFMSWFTNDAIRPFVSGAAGMFVGSEASNSVLSQNVHSETAFGGRVGAGVDFILANHFLLGATVGYNVMSNFSNPVGGNKNYNGSDFLFQAKYIF